MTEQTHGDPPRGIGQKSSTTDQILDLLLDALAERQQMRQGVPSSRVTPSPGQQPPTGERGPAPSPLTAPEDRAPQPAPPATKGVFPARPAPPPAERRPTPPPAAGARLSPPAPRSEPGPGEEGWAPPARLPSICCPTVRMTKDGPLHTQAGSSAEACREVS